MKIRPIPELSSTRPQIFDGGYEHPWYQYLNKPNPPSQESIERAKFKDKTYHWKGGNHNSGSGKQRTTK